jgi:hypothetical protein
MKVYIDDNVVYGKIVTGVTVTLSSEEALWLRSYLQNPIGDPHDEDKIDAEMRGTFFSKLPSESALLNT